MFWIKIHSREADMMAQAFNVSTQEAMCCLQTDSAFFPPHKVFCSVMASFDAQSLYSCASSLFACVSWWHCTNSFFTGPRCCPAHVHFLGFPVTFQGTHSYRADIPVSRDLAFENAPCLVLWRLMLPASTAWERWQCCC